MTIGTVVAFIPHVTISIIVLDGRVSTVFATAARLLLTACRSRRNTGLCEPGLSPLLLGTQARGLAELRAKAVQSGDMRVFPTPTRLGVQTTLNRQVSHRTSVTPQAGKTKVSHHDGDLVEQTSQDFMAGRLGALKPTNVAGH